MHRCRRGKKNLADAARRLISGEGSRSDSAIMPADVAAQLRANGVAVPAHHVIGECQPDDDEPTVFEDCRDAVRAFGLCADCFRVSAMGAVIGMDWTQAAAKLRMSRIRSDEQLVRDIETMTVAALQEIDAKRPHDGA